MQFLLRDGTEITIRPITPADAPLEQAFVRGLSAESRYFRFMNTLRELSPEMLARLTHPDHAREVALIALVAAGGGQEPVGIARYAVSATDPASCEFAVAVADAWQNRGIGSRLLSELIGAAHRHGLKRIEGQVLASNVKMLEFMHFLGFETRTMPDDPSVKHVALALA